MTTTTPSQPARLLLALVRAYRVTGSLRAPRCRFHPTCSQYALDAIEVHGAWRGSGMAIRRVLRCHPFHPGGIDHVPGRDDPRTNTTVSPRTAAANTCENHPATPPTSQDEASHDAVVA